MSQDETVLVDGQRPLFSVPLIELEKARVVRLFGAILCLWALLTPALAQVDRLPRPSFSLAATLDANNNPLLSWTDTGRETPRQRLMLRSTTDLRTTKDGQAFPIASLEVPGSSTSFRDLAAPQDVQLSYQLKLVYADGRTAFSNVAFVHVPAPRWPGLKNPSLFVDKLAYCLTVLDDGRPVRRFPIALGANPVNRKLHLDRASTPEGLYHVSGLQREATFYRAYDLNYPNELDRVRYRMLADRGELPDPLPDIGGEIQIHGEGIDGNWTWGCIALRNEDMDQLFSRPELGKGVPVVIVGCELRPEDIECQLNLTEQERRDFMELLVDQGIASGRSPKHWLYGLCKFQAANGLLVTGFFDRPTRRLLESQAAFSTR